MVRAMTPQLAKELFAIACDGKNPAGARVLATSVLLDRGHGRPARAQPISAATDDLSKLSDGELIELIATENEREEAEAEAEAANR